MKRHRRSGVHVARHSSAVGVGVGGWVGGWDERRPTGMLDHGDLRRGVPPSLDDEVESLIYVRVEAFWVQNENSGNSPVSRSGAPSTCLVPSESVSFNVSMARELTLVMKLAWWRAGIDWGQLGIAWVRPGSLGSVCSSSPRLR